jgi:hypothetical protein
MDDDDELKFLYEIKLQISTMCEMKKLISSLSNNHLATLKTHGTSLIFESLNRLFKNRHSIFMVRSNQVCLATYVGNYFRYI